MPGSCVTTVTNLTAETCLAVFSNLLAQQSTNPAVLLPLLENLFPPYRLGLMMINRRRQ
jgi:hypothetical protein